MSGELADATAQSSGDGALDVLHSRVWPALRLCFVARLGAVVEEAGWQSLRRRRDRDHSCSLGGNALLLRRRLRESLWRCQRLHSWLMRCWRLLRGSVHSWPRYRQPPSGSRHAPRLRPLPEKRLHVRLVHGHTPAGEGQRGEARMTWRCAAQEAPPPLPHAAPFEQRVHFRTSAHCSG